MNRLRAYLVLPERITPFEHRYLARITRIGLWWIAAHVPLLMAVAALAGTSVLEALVLTCLVAAGPLLAHRLLRRPRVVARVFGVAAMCLSGLLVHVGQGPMQIEMHFHFFVSIALLAVFADPLVIVAAAATAALHHLVLWLVLPSSVFNYDATIWTVVVHASFVFLESAGACFVARTFFDNVVGLDHIITERTAQLEERSVKMKLVLDNVDQGLVALGAGGELADERSAALADLLGPPGRGESLWTWLGRTDEEAGVSAKVFWDMLVEGALPEELVLDQLPKRITRGGRVLDLRYKALYANGVLERVLLVVTDVTNEVERERAERDQRETFALFERARADRGGLLDFRDECRVVVGSIVDPDSPVPVVLRSIHTLKGNAGLHGLGSLVQLCHDVETRIVESGRLTESDRAGFADRWTHLEQKLDALTGEMVSARLEVDREDHRAAIARLRAGSDPEAIARELESWELESARVRLAVLGEHARQLAERLGKGPVSVTTESNGVRFAPGELRSMWAALMHIVRNAVDHGLESAEERAHAGKPEVARLVLTTSYDGDDLVLAVSDDGIGVDWEAVRARAVAKGLPSKTSADLERALFADGLSTRSEATELSGRGVGMSAVLAECERRQGSVRVRSERGAGTTIEIRLPRRAVALAA